jgi:hypothetical protein
MNAFSPNPLRWRKEHAAALAVAVALGGVCGIVLGYVVSNDRMGCYVTGRWGPFATYLLGIRNSCGGYDGRSLEWGFFGAIVGAALVYIRQLLSP